MSSDAIDTQELPDRARGGDKAAPAELFARRRDRLRRTLDGVTRLHRKHLRAEAEGMQMDR